MAQRWVGDDSLADEYESSRPAPPGTAPHPCDARLHGARVWWIGACAVGGCRWGYQRCQCNCAGAGPASLEEARTLVRPPL